MLENVNLNNMKFTEQKELLLESCEQLLKFVKQKEMFGGPHDVLDDEYINRLEVWLIDAIDFVEKYGDCSINNDFKANTWIINGERVCVDRINKILSIIENIKENS